MSKTSSSDDVGDSNETTEATLATLTMQINEFVSGETLDSRCAAKLVKRLKKEADAVAESCKATKTGQKELKKAFDAVDAALCDHDARLLVTANAALRTTDEVARPRQSP
jgi:hypothetical protein